MLDIKKLILEKYGQYIQERAETSCSSIMFKAKSPIKDLNIVLYTKDFEFMAPGEGKKFNNGIRKKGDIIICNSKKVVGASKLTDPNCFDIIDRHLGIRNE